MRLRRSHGAPRKVAELDADAHGPEKPKQSYAWHLRLLLSVNYTLIRDKTDPHNND